MNPNNPLTREENWDELTGKEDGFARELERCFPRIQRFCQAMINHQQDGMDLAQDVILIAIERKKSFRHESNLQTWLLGIAVNVGRSWVRRQTVRRRVMNFLGMSNSNHTNDQTGRVYDDQDTIQYGLSHLDSRSREILLLRYFEDLQIDEIAKITHSSRAATDQRLSRARKKISRSIKPTKMNDQNQNQNENTEVPASSDSLSQSLRQTSHRIGVAPVSLDWDVIDSRLTERRKRRRRIKNGGFLAVVLAIGLGTFYFVGRETVEQPLAQQTNTEQQQDKTITQSDEGSSSETTQMPAHDHDLVESSGGGRAVDNDMLESINQHFAHFQLMQQLQQQIRQEERNYYELVRSRAESDFLRAHADSF